MTLTWPWWSLEGSILVWRIELATHLKKKLSYLMYQLLSRGQFEFKVSQANDPTLRLLGLARLRNKRCMCFDNLEIMILKNYI